MKYTPFFLILLLMSCSQEERDITFSVLSPVDQSYTVVSLPLQDINLADQEWDNIRVEELDNGQMLTHQWIRDEGGNKTELLVGLALEKDMSKQLRMVKGQRETDEPKVRTFSRFVPERTDDFTWENDKVAFRTYGPEALRMVRDKEPGGTFSSGIDAWTKKVDYPIIDKWYQKELSGEGSYHKDTGEGADLYHVGISRGVGGTGFWYVDTLYAAENFIEYKMLAEGPLRTIFQLRYKPYQAGGISIEETKMISLDLGSQLTKYEIEINSSEPLPYLTVGLTLHENEGEPILQRDKGYFGYWEPMEGTMLGTGILADPDKIDGYHVHVSEHRDQSHILLHLKPDSDNKVVYYSGFGWDQAGQFRSKEDWEGYLKDFSNARAGEVLVSQVK